MNSKTPRVAIGEFVDASFTQTAKKNRVQSRVKNNDDIPRSPSFVPTPRKIAAAARLTKSPGRAVLRGKGGVLTPNKQNSSWMPNSQHRSDSIPKSPKSPFSKDRDTKNRDHLMKSPADQYKQMIASIGKSPRHAIKHDRVSSLRSTPRISLSQPAEDITPGTMVAAFLGSKDSTLPFVRQRARTSQTGSTSSMPAQLREEKHSVVKARRRSIGESEKETPRALIQNFLENVNSSQTPAISSHRIQANKYVSPDLALPIQSSYHTPSPFKSSSNSERTHDGTAGLSVQRRTRRTPRPHAPFHFDLPGPVPSDSEFPGYDENIPEAQDTPSPFKLSTSDVSSPSVQNTVSDRSQRFSARKRKNGFLLDIPDHLLVQEDVNNARGEDSMDSTKAQYSFDLQSSREVGEEQYLDGVANPEQAYEGMNLSHAVPSSFVPEFTSTQQQAQTRRDDPERNNDEEDDDNQYEDQDQMEDEENLVAETATQEKPKKPRKPRQKQKYSLPVSMVKRSFMRFSDKRLSKEALEEVMKVCEVYWDNLCADLKAYANHAGRKNANMDDFVLLFKRQGHINDKVSLNALITQYLCMEDRRRLIPVARSGNRIELWK